MIVSLPETLKGVKSPSTLQEEMTISKQYSDSNSTKYMNGFNTLMLPYNNLINKAKLINYLHN